MRCDAMGYKNRDTTGTLAGVLKNNQKRGRREKKKRRREEKSYYTSSSNWIDWPWIPARRERRKEETKEKKVFVYDSQTIIANYVVLVFYILPTNQACPEREVFVREEHPSLADSGWSLSPDLVPTSPTATTTTMIILTGCDSFFRYLSTILLP